MTRIFLHMGWHSSVIRSSGHFEVHVKTERESAQVCLDHTIRLHVLKDRYVCVTEASNGKQGTAARGNWSVSFVVLQKMRRTSSRGQKLDFSALTENQSFEQAIPMMAKLTSGEMVCGRWRQARF